jgi:hypothetical protein
MLLRDVKKKFPVGSRWKGKTSQHDTTFEVTEIACHIDGVKTTSDDAVVGEGKMCIVAKDEADGCSWNLYSDGSWGSVKLEKRIDLPKFIEVLEGEGELIEGRLFENLEEAQDCPVCAVGALIRGLPEDQFADAIEFMREKNYNGSIGSTYMKPVQDMLTNHYNLSVSDLQSLMAANDYAREQERKEKVLKKAKEIAQ